MQKKRAQAQAGITPLPEPLKTRPRTLLPSEPPFRYSPTRPPTTDRAPYDTTSPDYHPAPARSQDESEDYDEIMGEESPADDSKTVEADVHSKST